MARERGPAIVVGTGRLAQCRRSRFVDGIDFELADRASLAIVGPSGCGQSTLFGVTRG